MLILTFKNNYQWPSKQMIKCWYDTGIVFRIRHFWEIRKVVNGHKSAAAASHSCTLIRQMAGLIS